MLWALKSPLLSVVIAAFTFLTLAQGGTVRDSWKSPLIKEGKLDSPLVEVTPFTFNGRLYLLENWQKQWELTNPEDGSHFQEDEVRIRDIESEEIVSTPLTGCGLGVAFVWEGTVYVFAGNWGTQAKWNIGEILMTSSTDLHRWSTPEVVLKANDTERFFNVSVCRGPDRFNLLVESNDPPWPAFTFKYFDSDDLKTWRPIENAYYGREKYVGGPAFYYFGDYFYTLYLESLGKGFYQTQVTRSKDLIHWQEAPEGRPLVTYDPESHVNPIRSATLTETNASDAELCEWKGETLVYYTGGDQHFAGDLQRAKFEGTPQELLESFYEEPAVVVPTENQVRYQEAQMGAFVHFGLATYDAGEFLSTPKPEVFNPKDLDAEQWVRAAKSFGARHIVLTAKHHSGFCLWPTSTTVYSVKASPWENGQGDVVAEFAQAARSQGLGVGLYLSAGDKNVGCTSTPDPMGQRKLVGDRNQYFPLFLGQLRELLSDYGELSVVWFDGAYDPFGWDVKSPDGRELGPAYGEAIASMVHELQPNAVIFNGNRPDVRWSGSEQGWAPYPLWNVIEIGEGHEFYVPPYLGGWFIPEANIHTRSSWFWKPDSDGTLKTVEQLMEAYHESVGRGANLLVNMTPDTAGLVPQAEVERLAAFGAMLEGRYSKPLAEVLTDAHWSEGNTLELDLPEGRAIDRVVIEEDLRFGQRVRAYRIEYWKDGEWVLLVEGQSIGRKRIERFNPIQTPKARLKVVETAPLPKIRHFAAYPAL